MILLTGRLNRCPKMLSILIFAIFVLFACSTQSTQPGPNSIGGVVEKASYLLIDWPDGRRILIWDDIPWGDQGASSSSSTSNPPFQQEGSAQSGDGRHYEYSLAISDSQQVDFTIDGLPYDLEQGRLFLVHTIGGPTRIEQLDIDLNGLTPTNDGIEAFGRQTPKIADMIAGSNHTTPVPDTGEIRKPTLTPWDEELRTASALDIDDALVQDALAFAEDQGIEPEEALRRLKHQQTIGDIQPMLESDLPESYGGLWVEHQPHYRIVIALTQGDDSTVQPYVTGKPWAEFVEVIQVKHTLNELRDAQATAMEAAQEINTIVSTAANVKQNRVEVYVGNPDLFRADLASAGIELPEAVEILPIDSEQPLPDTNQGVLLTAETPDGRVIVLPKQPPTAVSMAALIEGLLVEQNGCLRLVEEGSQTGFLVLWPSGSQLHVSTGAIEVLNGEGQVIARTGEPLHMGGGAMESSASMSQSDEAIPGLPLDGCPGPYWVAGELTALAQ